MSTQVDVLDYSGLRALRHLTFPAVWKVVADRYAPTVLGVAARTTDITAGLAVAVPGPAGQFELLSVYVVPLLRRLGLGGRMLAAIEAEFRARGFRLGVHFLRVNEREQGAPRFFISQGWTRPVLNKLVCQSTMPLAFQTPWLVEAHVPDRFRVVDWRSLSVEQRAAIPDSVAGGLNDDIDPFEHEQDHDPLTSVALVEAGDGAVRGWVITHRLDAHTLRWTCSFLHPSLQATALMRGLWLNVARRQSACPGLIDFVFTVPITEPRMARFAVRRMRPWLSELAYACTTVKKVA